jgi:hypothetical protein
MFQRGVAAVEAAFLLVPLVILLLGTAELGRVFYQYNSIAKATRDGARYLSMMAPGVGHGAARCLVVTGSPTCEEVPLVKGLAISHVNICDATTCAATHANVAADGSGVPVMNLVTVTVAGYQSVNFLPIPVPSIEFDPISVTMRQP